VAKPRIQQQKTLIPDRPDSPVTLAIAVAQMALMIIGIAGVATAIFGENGLLASLAKKATEAESLSFIVAIPLLFVAIYLARQWYEKTFAKSSSATIATFAMYTMTALGAWYLIQFLRTGNFG
jgi:undecaprenyl pyrophosphate phosphatase UppP